MTIDGKLLYLSSPIDQVGAGAQDSARRLIGWRGNIKQRATEHGWVIYDPGTAFQVRGSVPPNDRIRKINHRAYTLADAMIALLPPGMPTIGVPTEVERMRGYIPIAVVGAERSWALAGDPLIYLAPTLMDGLSWLEGAVLDPKWEREQRRADPLPFCGPGWLPTRTYPGDAGFDLYVYGDHEIPPQSFVDIPSGVAVELPGHMWGRIVGRSSTLRRRGLLVSEGVVDSGYRGDLFAGVWNLTDKPVKVSDSDRLAQFIPQSLTAATLRPVRVESLSDSDRGTNGFGSTGA